MSRLIDADALIEFCAERWIPLNIDAVNMQPTIQPEKTQLSKEGTTSDLISRQAALEKVRTMQTYKLFMGDDMILIDKADVQTELMMLPPAQPEPKEGHWIGSDGSYICSECNGSPIDFIETMGDSFDAYMETPMPYCPNCGAKMTISTK